MNKLKPCPFCGNEVELEKIPLWHGSHGYHGCYEYEIKCSKCGCTVDQPKNDSIYRSEEEAKENAIKAWNKRMPSAQPEKSLREKGLELLLEWATECDLWDIYDEYYDQYEEELKTANLSYTEELIYIAMKEVEKTNEKFNR